jgi:hypothetical protein
MAALEVPIGLPSFHLVAEAEASIQLLVHSYLVG